MFKFHAMSSDRGGGGGQNDDIKTFILVKPDGVQRGIVGKIITRWAEKSII